MLNPIEGEPRGGLHSRENFIPGKPYRPTKKELEAQEKAEHRVDNLKVASQKTRERYEKEKWWTPEHEQALGRGWIRGMETTAYGTRTDGPKEKARETLGRAYDSYKNYFPQESDFINFRNGFFAEFAVAVSLQKEGLKVYYSSPEEDVKSGVDWLARDPKSGVFFAIQVKCLKTVQRRGETVVLDRGDPGSVFKERIRDYGRGQENELGFKSEFKSLLRFCANRSERTVPVYIFLPPPDSEFSRFSSETAEPDLELGAELSGHLGAAVSRIEKGESHGQAA